MAAAALPSAKWLYCGEPDESQRAVLGKGCGAGADPSRDSPFRLGSFRASRRPFPSRARPFPFPPSPALVSTASWGSASAPPSSHHLSG